MQQGAEFSRRELLDELNTIDPPSLGTSFDMPIFLFEGTHDQQTPIELAEEYFAAISAPRKAFVRFEGCHDFVVMNCPELFLRELLTHAPRGCDERVTRLAQRRFRTSIGTWFSGRLGVFRPPIPLER